MAYDEQTHVDGWQTYFNWIDELRNKSSVLNKYDCDETFKGKLMSCQSNYDRFRLVWENQEIIQEIKKIYSQDLEQCRLKRQSRLGKSSAESKRMRELGNKSFKEGEFLAALKHYTQAIRYAPFPSQEDKAENSLALALANRSAALYSLTRYRLCLLDIDLAIQYGYPEVSMFKLLIRKVKCLHILSIWANDFEQIKESLLATSKRVDTKEYIKTEINNMFEFIEQSLPEEMEKDEPDSDETAIKISNASKSLSQAADCVEMSYDSNKGRYLITNKDVSFGRLLIAEEPFVCNLVPTKRDQYCDSCFANLHSCGLGCTSCTQVLYCSIDCLETKAPIHSFECNSFLDFQEKLGVAYLVSHIMFKINFNLESIPVYNRKTFESKSLDDVIKIPASDWPDLVYKNDYASVLSLMDHASDQSYADMLGFILTAVYLIVAFQDYYSSSIQKLADSQAQLVVGSVVLRHLLQLHTNLISILAQNFQDLTTTSLLAGQVEEQPIGIGLYATISLLNHSCRPDILSIFQKNKFVARASRSLECGTEINYCYGPSFTRMSKKDRQQRLKEQYFFDCACECCTSNAENECRALVCSNCAGPVIYNLDLSHKCTKCNAENMLNVENYLTQVKQLKSTFEKLTSTTIEATSFKCKLDKLQMIEKKLSKLIYWKNPIFVKIKSQLVELCETEEILEEALKYCEEELDLVDRSNGEGSIESILTKLKYINLKWQHLYYTIESQSDKFKRNSAIQELRSLHQGINTTKSKLKDLLASTSITGAESTFENELKFLAGTQANINKYLATLEEGANDKQSGDQVEGCQ